MVVGNNYMEKKNFHEALTNSVQSVAQSRQCDPCVYRFSTSLHSLMLAYIDGLL